MFFNVFRHRTLNDNKLIELGVLDSNHRRAILSKASGAGDFSDDFDSMLGDLSSVIKDLETFSVVVSCLIKLPKRKLMLSKPIFVCVDGSLKCLCCPGGFGWGVCSTKRSLQQLRLHPVL